MASGALIKELSNETTCPLCMGYFKNQVMIGACGHSFCEACLTEFWRESDNDACPQCTEVIRPKSFRPSWQLGSVVKLEEGIKIEEEGAMGEKRQESPLGKEDEVLIGLVHDGSQEPWEQSEFPTDKASQEYKMTDNGGASSSHGRKGRGVSWRHKETLDLLEIWGEQKIQDQLRSSHRNIDFFEYIAQEMAARGHRRTAVECRSKTKVMRLEYKRVIGHNSRAGNNKVTCPFYRQLHRILRGDASVTPKRVARSLNFKRVPEQAAVVLKEPFPQMELDVVNPTEEESARDVIASESSVGEGTAETGTNDIIQIEEEGSSVGSGKDLDSQRLQMNLEVQDPLESLDPAMTTSKTVVSPATRLSLIRARKKKGERAESMFELFMQESREEFGKEQEERSRNRAMFETFLKVFEQDAAESREERKQCLEAMRANSDILRDLVSGLSKLTDTLVSQQQTGTGNQPSMRHPLHSATHSKENLPQSPAPVARTGIQEALPSHPTSSTSTPQKSGSRRPAPVIHTPPKVYKEIF
ncbi:uncharacterized protein PHA67_005744 isoform 1-T3 [Liasis olivaceus]